ncbi:hypothetical protein BJ878DRAFT_233372 [Calycina marina]|uniref:Uncharacterized protein n=1 Tax=Calycina marina TaxID=1763456 RepID=A0A9P8CDJ2_9HELO|nr:hypothetical protein BJ878DRAFT_233372 [Calycina marina]
MDTNCVKFLVVKLVFKTIKGTVEVYDTKTNLKSQLRRGKEDRSGRCEYGGLEISHDGTLMISKDGDDKLRF